MRQRELEIRLEQIPRMAEPNPDLEQYRTPPKIAADVLYRALARGDVAGKRVIDLGCGTGMFLAGAGLLGAAHVTGVDVDEAAVELARQALDAFELPGEVRVENVDAVSGEYDTAIMNPPFGAQFAARHADSVFVEHALRVAPVAYSLHASETARHLERLAKELEADWETLNRYEFPLPHQFSFHSKEKVLVPVTLYRFSRLGHA